MLPTFIFLFDSTRQGDYAFTRFHSLVYWLVCRQDSKKLPMYFQETWMDDESRPIIDPVKFCRGSG